MPQRPVHPDEKVRAKRIETLHPLVVESQTIGTPMTYVLPMENVSRTGLLLGLGSYKKVPFLVNTLLELTVDPKGALFERPVACLGKIVRLQRDDERRPQYGVQIIHIEGRDQAAWDKTLEDLEQGERKDRFLPAAS